MISQASCRPGRTGSWPTVAGYASRSGEPCAVCSTPSRGSGRRSESPAPGRRRRRRVPGWSGSPSRATYRSGRGSECRARCAPAWSCRSPTRRPDQRSRLRTTPANVVEGVDVFAGLMERLADALQLQDRGDGAVDRYGCDFGGLGSSMQSSTIDVMSSGPPVWPTTAHSGATVRQRSSARTQRSTKTHVGRSAPIGGRNPGMVSSALVLARAVPWQAVQQPDGVRVRG